jgi:hypothetical protein
MLRSIVAVVVAYVAIAVLVMGLFTALWFGLGPDRLLVPGEWKGNLLITIAAPGITVLGGLFGGWLCAKIGRARGPVIALACVVLALGILMCYFTLQKPLPTGPREPGLTVQQIMEKGREPTWVAVSNPIIGAAAVLLGGLCTAGRGRKAGSSGQPG